MLWIQWIEIICTSSPRYCTSPFSSARITRERYSPSPIFLWSVILDDLEVLSIYHSLVVTFLIEFQLNTWYSTFLHLFEVVAENLNDNHSLEKKDLPSWCPLRFLYNFWRDLNNGYGCLFTVPNALKAEKHARFIYREPSLCKTKTINSTKNKTIHPWAYIECYHPNTR